MASQSEQKMNAFSRRSIVVLQRGHTHSIFRSSIFHKLSEIMESGGSFGAQGNSGVKSVNDSRFYPIE